MPSPLAPTITAAKDSAGNNLPNSKGTVTDGSITLSGLGFPGITLNISVTTGGTAQTPSTASVLVGANATWTATLTGLPAGMTVVAFTEDPTNSVTAPPPGTVSWSFTVTRPAQSAVLENFEGWNGIFFENHSRTCTDRDIGIHYQGANKGRFMPSRMVWGYSMPAGQVIQNGVGEPKGNVFCMSHYPETPMGGEAILTLYLRDPNSNTTTPLSNATFKYTSSVDCTVYAKDNNSKILDQKTLPITHTSPVPVTLTAPGIAIIEIHSAPVNAATTLGWSAMIGEVELTPGP
ncbi:hypothetical protein QF043_000101 [Pseudomonas sp. W3I7]|jgi:hypothetical protein|uniref:hypothetical protein n=1 Tax=Pseudomonas sp. W3I7 TaxID=3042292 RepID=UPI00278E1B35|nr:hypothetical protein [Pseudomonas sp. W3I7]MDQ0701309.1 hypothetical protein [Pseudomonas sp. W3I7]